MKKIKSIDNVYLATVGVEGNTSTYLSFTPSPDDMKELVNGDWVDGLCLEDNCSSITSLPTEPGFYAATLEFWFEQGYFEGYPADGESSIEIILSNVRKLNISDPKSNESV